MPINYKIELNKSQYDAVTFDEGPSLVIAGAGSGKTRVLTYKIAYLLEKGYAPWSILALTFTNKAAREMKNRISNKIGPDQTRGLWMGTFHSIFSRILRIEADAIGFSPRFTIYDASDSKNLVKSIVKEMGLDEKVYKPSAIQNRISQAKNRLISPDSYAANGEIIQADLNAKIPATKDIYKFYWERCKQADALDFDDLLFYTYLLFEKNPDICRKYSDMFNYVLVDEYQDTNYAQHCIIWQLTKDNQKVCVVGDDAQSIYSFRGANIDNILNFTRQYKNARLFKLEQNYRSTQTIVNAANSLIDKNSRQIKKDVYSEKEKGEPLGVFNAYSDVEEGDIVANKIVELHREHDYTFNDFAILYRTNAQSRIFEEALRKRTLPYCIYGGLSFYQRKEIKDVISYFRLAVNPNDEEAFKRIVNYPARGIGDTTIGKIIEAATNNHISLWNVICNPDANGLSINKGTKEKLQRFHDLMAQFIKEAPEKDAFEIGQELVKQSGIMNDIYQDRTPESLSRQENIEELLNGMSDFCSSRREEGDEQHTKLSDYLSEISLLTDQDDKKNEDGEKITLMTIHSAKGLEFKTVFVVGLEENLFPSPMAYDSMRQLEEERRLFYVAITRAEEHCFLSFARSRYRYGKMEFSNPSRFLNDIDTHFLELPKGNSFATRQKSDLFDDDRDEPYTDKRSYSYREHLEEERPRPMRNWERPQKESPQQAQPTRPLVNRTLKRVNSILQRPSVNSSPEAANIKVGQLIEHERFGRGEITKVEGVGDNCKATVQFQNSGVKQLLLKFARFKIIE